jgi:protoporphyrinogen IX oxidase
MLWIKAFHIIFMVTWFAGLFYLPRLFIYHRAADDSVSRERFCTMEKRLFVIMTIGAVLTIAFGLTLIAMVPGFMMQHWLHIKLFVVVGLIAFHVYCWVIHMALAGNRFKRSDRWLRWYNELPTIALFVIVILAVVRPI